MYVVTRNTLNDVMDFDHVIRVHPDGSVRDAPPEIWAPEVTMDGDKPHISAQPGYGWSLLTGFTGQYGYNGPCMHPSEFIGGRMAEHILSRPGLYVAVVVTDLDSDEEAGERESWAVAYIEDDE